MCATARVSVPWAEREDGERDEINKPLKKQEDMHLSSYHRTGRKEYTKTKK